jgi:adenylate cyclase class IV
VNERELELKAVVDDPAALASRLVASGARRTFRGRMRDLRLDLPGGALQARDEVLRVRAFEPEGRGAGRAELSWKGPTRLSGPYKEREELRLDLADATAAGEIFARLGFVVADTIERWVEYYELAGAVLRIEWYPRMDVLVEVEGPAEAIERAVAATGLPRATFTAERLLDFAARYQQRTGTPAALNCAALGDASPSWPAGEAQLAPAVGTRVGRPDAARGTE